MYYDRELVTTMTPFSVALDRSTRYSRSRSKQASWFIFIGICEISLTFNRQGVGISFGPDVTERWCKLNNVSAIIRSHEVRQGKFCSSMNFTDIKTHFMSDGYQVEHKGLCITVCIVITIRFLSN